MDATKQLVQAGLDAAVSRETFEKWVADYTGHTKGFVSQFRSGDRYRVDSMWNKYWDIWNACRAAMLAQPVMPVEPTAYMQAAGAAAIQLDTTPINKLFTANAVYRAMLAVAPEVMTKLETLPDGFKLVPIEPTAEMLAAAERDHGLSSTAEGIYWSMLAAAPEVMTK